MLQCSVFRGQHRSGMQEPNKFDTSNMILALTDSIISLQPSWLRIPYSCAQKNSTVAGGTRQQDKVRGADKKFVKLFLFAYFRFLKSHININCLPKENETEQKPPAKTILVSSTVYWKKWGNPYLISFRIVSIKLPQHQDKLSVDSTRTKPTGSCISSCHGADGYATKDNLTRCLPQFSQGDLSWNPFPTRSLLILY